MPRLGKLSNCRIARLAVSASQQQLAREMGVSQTLISEWERGARVPTPEQEVEFYTAIERLCARPDAPDSAHLFLEALREQKAAAASGKPIDFFEARRRVELAERQA